MTTFTRAIKARSFLRLALIGPAGSGKTMWSQAVASVLSEGKPFAVIDTEHGSASKYADLHSFDVLELDDFHPKHYTEGLRSAAAAGYPVCVVDSLSHAWAGKGGALALVDAKKRGNGNGFNAWADVTPIQNDLIEAILAPPMHVICTLRSKQAYAQEKDERSGKTVIRKLGLEPVQREGVEYEFDIVGTLDYEHTLTITKSRAPGLSDLILDDPRDLAKGLLDWLSSGDIIDRTPPIPDRAKCWRALEKYVRQGEELGLNVQHAKRIQMSEDAPTDEIVAVGSELRSRIEAARAVEVNGNAQH